MINKQGKYDTKILLDSKRIGKVNVDFFPITLTSLFTQENEVFQRYF